MLPILEREKPNLQWLKFTMVNTEMVSSNDNTARGFLPVAVGGLAAGQDALSSNVLKNNNSPYLCVNSEPIPKTIRHLIFYKSHSC